MREGRLAAVLCDLDGVLRHWDHATAATAALEREFDLAAGTVAATAFAPAVLNLAVTGQLSDEEWRARVARLLTAPCGSAQRAAQVVERWSRPLGRIDEEVLALLGLARRSVPVALVTNATTRLERDLRLLGVAEVIPEVVSSARIGVAKPDPAIYLASAERVGVAPNRCLFVDDLPANVRAAEELGMTGLLYREVADLRRALETALA